MGVKVKEWKSAWWLFIDHHGRRKAKRVGQMVKVGNRRSAGRTAARATIREALRTLSAILTTAEEELIPVNPARRVGRLIAAGDAGEAHEVEVFEREELSKVLEGAERDFPEYHPFVHCLARTGMRLGEAIALEWRDIDWRSRVILVRRSRRRRQVSEPKNGKARRVDMSAQLATVLKDLRTLQEAEAVVQGREPSDRVFSTPAGTPVDEDSFRRVWAAMLKVAGLRYRKPHTLRHSFATLLLEAGTPPVRPAAAWSPLPGVHPEGLRAPAPAWRPAGR